MTPQAIQVAASVGMANEMSPESGDVDSARQGQTSVASIAADLSSTTIKYAAITNQYILN